MENGDGRWGGTGGTTGGAAGNEGERGMQRKYSIDGFTSRFSHSFPFIFFHHRHMRCPHHSYPPPPLFCKSVCVSAPPKDLPPPTRENSPEPAHAHTRTQHTHHTRTPPSLSLSPSFAHLHVFHTFSFVFPPPATHTPPRCAIPTLSSPRLLILLPPFPHCRTSPIHKRGCWSA